MTVPPTKKMPEIRLNLRPVWDSCNDNIITIIENIDSSNLIATARLTSSQNIQLGVKIGPHRMEMN